MTYREPAEKTWMWEEIQLSWAEIEALRFLLYRVLEESGTPAETQLLREGIPDKLERAIQR